MASFPGSVKTFTAKTDLVDYPQAEHINSLQDEVTAIEQGLINGLTIPLKVYLGTLADQKLAVDLTAAWNDAGEVFTLIKANVTDSASSSASLLMDLQLGGVSKFKVFKDGSLVTPYKNTALQFEAIGGTATVSLPVFHGYQTWNAGGVTFEAIRLEITNTASAAASLLMNLLVGGASKFSVDKSGSVTAAGHIYIVDTNFYAWIQASDPIINFDNTDAMFFRRSTNIVEFYLNDGIRCQVRPDGRVTVGADPTDALDVATKQYVDARAASKKRSLVLVVPGDPTAAGGLSLSFIMPTAGTIAAVKSTCRTAVASGTYTYDINKNGTTIYGTQANRPTRANADGTAAKTHTAPDTTSFVATDVFSVDLDTAGSGIADMTFFIEFNEA